MVIQRHFQIRQSEIARAISGEFRPSVLVGVPAVWESVKKGIIAKVNSGSPIVKKSLLGCILGEKQPASLRTSRSWDY